MFFTKSIDEVTYQDVVSFCKESNPEGYVLDYKSDFPKNESLANTIAAFANTFGGILIIGVDAPKGLPKPPFKGVTYNPKMKYEEKVENVILSNIFEPVFPMPKVKICTSKNNKNAFILIKVEESEHVPHRTGQDRDIYIRTGQSSSPHDEERATYEKIEWLQSKRKKSVELRKDLINEAEKYFKESLEMRNLMLSDKASILTLKILPMFPSAPLFNYKNIRSITDHIRVQESPTFAFPEMPERGEVIDTIQNGFHHLTLPDKTATTSIIHFRYVHINSYGIYMLKQNLQNSESIANSTGQDITYVNISNILYLFLLSATKYFKQIPYLGSLSLRVEFTNALGKTIKHPYSGLRYFSNPKSEYGIIPGNYLRWERTTTLQELENNLEAICISLMDDIGWSLGIFVDEKDITEIISDKRNGLKRIQAY